MSDWQKIIKDESIASLDKLAEKFGHDVIDVEALRPAFDNFQMRLTPAALNAIKEVGDPMWQQYIPTVEELDVVDGVHLLLADTPEAIAVACARLQSDPELRRRLVDTAQDRYRERYAATAARDRIRHLVDTLVRPGERSR